MLYFMYESAAIAGAEIHKLMRDPTELFSRAVQPVLWLAVFGQVFSQVRGIPTGNLRYLDYIARRSPNGPD
jgi:ABC-2 type transport system permease protein